MDVDWGAVHDLLERGWVQGITNSWSEDGASEAYCLLGAISQVGTGIPDIYDDDDEFAAESVLGPLRLVTQVMCENRLTTTQQVEDEGMIRTVAEYNDTDGRTKEEVLALVDLVQRANAVVEVTAAERRLATWMDVHEAGEAGNEETFRRLVKEAVDAANAALELPLNLTDQALVKDILWELGVL